MPEIIAAVRVVGRTERLECLVERKNKTRTRRSLPFSKESLDKILPQITNTTTFQILNKQDGRRYGVPRQSWFSLPAKDLIAAGKRGSVP